jgi:hypothetical protein
MDLGSPIKTILACKANHFELLNKLSQKLCHICQQGNYDFEIVRLTRFWGKTGLLIRCKNYVIS